MKEKLGIIGYFKWSLLHNFHVVLECLKYPYNYFKGKSFTFGGLIKRK